MPNALQTALSVLLDAEKKGCGYEEALRNAITLGGCSASRFVSFMNVFFSSLFLFFPPRACFVGACMGAKLGGVPEGWVKKTILSSSIISLSKKIGEIRRTRHNKMDA